MPGGISQVALLDAQLQQLQTALDQVSSQAARFSDSATLFQALGGGWWNETHSGLTRTTRQKLPTALLGPPIRGLRRDGGYTMAPFNRLCLEFTSLSESRRSPQITPKLGRCVFTRLFIELPKEGSTGRAPAARTRSSLWPALETLFRSAWPAPWPRALVPLRIPAPAPPGVRAPLWTWQGSGTPCTGTHKKFSWPHAGSVPRQRTASFWNPASRSDPRLIPAPRRFSRSGSNNKCLLRTSRTSASLRLMSKTARPTSQPTVTTEPEFFVHMGNSDPTGRDVYVLQVTNMKTWVRCIWLDLQAIQIARATEFEHPSRNFQISPDSKVYKVCGNVLTTRKLYNEAQEYEIHATDALDITTEAQSALDSAKAYYTAHKNWPTDDNF